MSSKKYKVIPLTFTKDFDKNTTEKFDVSNLFCGKPFNTVHVGPDGTMNSCCPQWFSSPIGNILDISIVDALTSSYANSIKKSILNGSFSHCNQGECGPIQESLHGRQKHGLLQKTKNDILSLQLPNNPTITVVFDFEDSCNFKCGSCRTGVNVTSIKNLDQQTIDVYDRVLASIYDMIGRGFKINIVVSGAADPFASPLFNEFLQIDDPLLLSNMSLSLITNVSLFTPDKMEYPMLKRCLTFIYFSVDAATEYTYENVTRLNGRWATLHKNLSWFDNYCTTVRAIPARIGYVVSGWNYKEIEQITSVYFDRYKCITSASLVPMSQPSFMSDAEFKGLDVTDPLNPAYEEMSQIVGRLFDDERYQLNALVRMRVAQ